MRITIGMPVGGMVKVQTMACTIGALAQIGGQKQFAYRSGCYVHENRAQLVHDAERFEADYLIFVDSDMQFNGDAFAKLIELDKDVVGVNYCERKMPLTSTVKFDINGKPAEGKIEWPTEPFRVRSCGTGLMAIKMHVFGKIEKPWFGYLYGEDGVMLTGEDNWFCQQVRKAGLEVWCEPRLPVQHLGDYAY